MQWQCQHPGYRDCPQLDLVVPEQTARRGGGLVNVALCFGTALFPSYYLSRFVGFILEVEVAQLTIQQADVSFAPAKYLGKQTQSW